MVRSSFLLLAFAVLDFEVEVDSGQSFAAAYSACDGHDEFGLKMNIIRGFDVICLPGEISRTLN